MKMKFITIAGKLGSGKSSTGKELSKQLGFERLSMGDLQRSFAEKLGLNFEEYHNKIGRDRSFDKKVDEYQIEIADTRTEVVLDSRLGWYFIPESFKVFLELPTEVAAERMVHDAKTNPTREVEQITDKDSQMEKIEHRMTSEIERYKKLYDIDNHFDHKNFDLVVRTDEHSLLEVVDIIKKAYENWLKE
jgi:cytidylate kinase